MQFDLFHSVGRIDTISPRLTDRQVFESVFDQAVFAEELGFDTLWVAESHFSSEVQKQHLEPVIPNYHGEVGLNCDSCQFFHMLCERTKKINFGTAIMNIVGGNGGPIAAADRIQSLAFLNNMKSDPRRLYIGVAAGRFPYINSPFGIVPRSEEERQHWPEYKRIIFLEALEIFLRLCLGETVGSESLQTWKLQNSGLPYQSRWQFEPIKLVPDLDPTARENLRFVLGSHDPSARDVAFSLTDVDVFNLSFTPPEKLNEVHEEMERRCAQLPNRQKWCRHRLPRTLLVFIDKSSHKAYEMASKCFDTYIEAMRGTVRLPPKEFLMTQALIGTPDEIRKRMDPESGNGFHADDRLMLWFEFNQGDLSAIKGQMELFANEVREKLG